MIRQRPHGRREPYTEIGIRRMQCAHPRCSNGSRQQWSSCALGGRYLAVCNEHDLAINRWLLKEFGVPGSRRLLRHYERKLAS